MATKSIKQTISPTLQKIFILTAGISYLFEAVMLVQLLGQVYGANWEFSPFLAYALTGVGLPLIGFGFAYLVLRRVKPVLWKVFVAVLLALILTIIQRIIMALVFELSYIFMFMGDWTGWLLPFIPAVAALVFYGAILVWVHRTKIKSELTPAYLQKIIIGLAAGSFFISAATIATRIIEQYPTNQNLSGFFSWSIVDVILPIIFFVTAYIVVTRNVSRLTRLFRVIIWTIVGVCLVNVIDRLVVILYGSASADAGYWEQMSYNFGGYVIALGIYAALLLHPVHRR